MGILTVFAIYLILNKTGDDPRRYLFVKKVNKEVGAQGGASLYKTLLSTPPPPPSIAWVKGKLQPYVSVVMAYAGGSTGRISPRKPLARPGIVMYMLWFNFILGLHITFFCFGYGDV